MKIIGHNSMVRRFPNNYHEQRKFPGIKKRFTNQLRVRGSKDALLSTLRNFLFIDHSIAYEKTGKTNIPKLLIWGKDDRVIPFSIHNKVLEALPNIQFHIFKNTGHSPPYESVEQVTTLMKDFYK